MPIYRRNLTVVPGKWTVTESKQHNVVDLTITNEYKAQAPYAFTTQMAFKVTEGGLVFVNSVIIPAIEKTVLPKIGFTTETPAGFERMTWFGRGPWESYEDRKEACFEGVYQGTVQEQWTGYVMPQENGNKEDVRWMALQNADGEGMLFIAPDHMAASAAHWRAADVYVTRDNRKMHPYEMNFTPKTIVCLDARNRALGNASCGPDVMDKYELKAETTLFNFIMMPVQSLDGSANMSNLVEKARISSPVCSQVAICNNDNGTISLTSTTHDATIYYSIDNAPYRVYTKPFTLTQGGTVKAYATRKSFFNSMITTATIPLYVDKTLWRVVNCDSEQGGAERAANAIDNNTATIWHTQYGDKETAYPHEIVVDMGKTYKVGEFTYTARKDGSNGRIKNYKLYMSNNPSQWGTPVAEGSFANNANVQHVKLSARPQARYFKLIALSEVDGRAWASAAELSIVAIR